MKKHLCIVAVMLFSLVAKADEGMWLMMYIKKLNEADMQKKGMKITAEDIYSLNKSSLKDAVCQLGGGGFCTGEVISKEGLVLTNHHCAYDAIQAHSSVNHDYLSDGFWAMEKSQELPVDGMWIRFMVSMADVTADLEAAGEGKEGEEKENAIEAKKRELKDNATNGTHYDADITPMYEGNEFYLFVYETFTDIRLVGAPPSSIGKFGGDTDNWMWPRHTGDFSLLRIYSGSDGKPAKYSKDNIPFVPRHHLPISLKGVKENDFAMILGFPGSTDRFLTSYGVKMAMEQEQPLKVKIMGKRLETMKSHMEMTDSVRIKYASNYAGVANTWKYYIGQTRGLKRLNVVGKKQEEEKQFTAWVNANAERKEKYGNVLSNLEKAYAEYASIQKPFSFMQDAYFSTEGTSCYTMMYPLYEALLAKKDPEAIKKITEKIKAKYIPYFKDHEAATDQDIMQAMLTLYYSDAPVEYHPEKLKAIAKKYKNNFAAFTADLYKKSVLLNRNKVFAFLDKPNLKAFEKDEGFKLYVEMRDLLIAKVILPFFQSQGAIGENMKLFIDGFRKMNSDKAFSPDANLTMRMSYGSILDYSGADAVNYNYFTTLEGVMEKEDPTNDEFIVPEKLKQLYAKKDFGQYAENGVMHVGFLSNNDITGGNSGSPVINANGELVGTAFDGNWEAMSGDIAFEPALQRTISVDIRYVLFLIDKYAGANNLIKELTLVK